VQRRLAARGAAGAGLYPKALEQRLSRYFGAGAKPPS
jgi:hypothetical protein